MQGVAQAKGRRLLRVLLVRVSKMPSYSRAEGVLWLIVACGQIIQVHFSLNPAKSYGSLATASMVASSGCGIRRTFASLSELAPSFSTGPRKLAGQLRQAFIA
jgi:hypothetical protein